METNQDLTEKPRSETSYSSFFASTANVRKPKDSDILRRIIRRFRKKEYTQLKQELTSYRLSHDFIDDFFLRAGEGILSWSIVTASDADALKFLYENVSNDVLQEMLANNENDYILRDFFCLEFDEVSNLHNIESERVRTEKLELLFKIDADKMQSFFEEFASKRSVTPMLMKNYTEALESYKSTLPSVDLSP